MFDWVENRLQAKGLKQLAHSCRKICMTSFFKRRKVFMQKQPSKVFFEKGLIRNFPELQANMCRDLFF